MLRPTRILLCGTSWQLVLQVVGVGMLAGPARAATPKINDHARLFSDAAVSRATEQLQEIKRHYRADVVVETFQKIPFHRDPWRKFKKMDAAAREAFFRNWAKGRVPGPDGVYVFVFQNPEAKNVQVQVGRDVRAAGELTPADGDQVRDRIRADLDAGHNDKALLAAVQTIRDRLDANLGGSVAPRPFDWPGVAEIIVAVAGLWLALALIQVFRGGVFQTPFAGVSTLGHGIGCNFGACLRAALAAPGAARAEHGEAGSPPVALHHRLDAGYAEPVHDE